MAWSWSHTQEAYDNALHNLTAWCVLHTKRLYEVYAEWKAYNPKGEYPDLQLDEDVYHEAVVEAAGMEPETLAECVWRKASAQSFCDEGGHFLWMCPFGCPDHKVGADLEKQ